MIGRELKPDLSEEKVGLNPLSNSLVLRIRKIPSGSYKPDKEGILMPVEIEYEQAELYKAFCNRETRLVLAQMKYRELQLWQWIMQTIDYGQDVIWIDVKRYKRECGIKDDKTFRMAVMGLAKCLFIAPCMAYKNTYFINPACGFKGSRANKYPDKINHVSDSE